MAKAPEQSDDLGTIRKTVIALIRGDGRNLTARQMAVLLTCYTFDTEQTVRSLAKHLHVPKPAITRALDQLAKFDLICRKADLRDRRSVLVDRTPTGSRFLRDLKDIMLTAAASQPEH